MKTRQVIFLRLPKVFRLIPVVGLLAAIVFSWGCTRNNGDIGVWFGTWSLTSVTVDGVEGTDYADNSTWSFQNSVVRIQVEYSHNYYSDHYGTWSREGDIFTLDFTHHEPNDTLPWSNTYKFPENMYFGMRQGIARLHIDRLSGGRADLTFENPENKTITYHLKKQN